MTATTPYTDAWNRTDQRDAAHSGLATNVSDQRDARSALEKAGLAGWNVQKRPLWADLRGYVPGGDPSNPAPPRGLSLPGSHATVRTDPRTGDVLALGIVGDRYKVTQNEEHALFLDTVVGEAQASYESALSLRGGALVYLTIKLPNHITVAGEDRVDLYLNAINSHDGSTQFMLNLDPVRAFCANQLSHFRRNCFKIKHTSTINGHVHAARESLKLAFKEADAFALQAERMASIELTDAQVEARFREIFPLKADAAKATRTKHGNVMDALATVYQTSQTNRNISGTAWGGFNAVVEYLDHVKPAKSSDARAERNIDDTLVAIKTKAANVFATV